MNNPVILKGNKYGIVVALNPEVSFQDLLIELENKLKQSEKFFQSKSQLAITFEGRTLTTEEIDEILSMIYRTTELKISCVLDCNMEIESSFMNALDTLNQKEVSTDHTETPCMEEVSSNEQSLAEGNYETQSEAVIVADNAFRSDGLFYKGTLRSGQDLESKESIVLIGDVNPGASIVSDGNIVIIGSLKGTACAGAGGNRKAFVMALSMNPMQIQIGDIIARSSDKPKRTKQKEEAEIAFVEDEHIYIEPVSKSVLNDITI